MKKDMVRLVVSMACAAAICATLTGVVSADAITTLGTKVNDTIITPMKTAFTLVGLGVGVTALIVAGIMAVMSNKMWKTLLIGGFTCLLIVVFAPVMATVITGLGG